MKRIKKAFTGLKSLAVGLGVTGRAFYAKNVTVIYPKEEVDNLASYRGHVELVGKEDAPDVPKCVACGSCAKACPSNAFTILCPVPPKEGEAASDPPVMGPAPQRGAKTPSKFILDFSLCSLCGQCVKTCPTKGLRFSNDPYLVSFTREDLKLDLLARLHSQAANSQPVPVPDTESVDK
ncbi:MAG: [Fe-S]-binding protein [Acidobacteria bacterium]|nr:MAG: [Fe-S]-binding protein [Acidobacteriota bacterium]